MYLTGLSPLSIAVGDFNNDMRLDFVVANTYDHSVSVFLGNGDGSFKNQMTYSADHLPINVLVGDFNNDNQLDIIVLHIFTSDIGVLLGYGNGSFGNQSKFIIKYC